MDRKRNIPELIAALLNRAANARREGTATALGDALHFEEAATALSAGLEVATPPSGEREVTKYAEHLAVLLHAKHYPEITQWRPMSGDLPGLLTQIDNMTTGLVRAAPSERDAPGHTDLMVAPETLDAFMEANPLPPDREAAIRREALEEALTPSGDTKAAYMGEFKFGIAVTEYDEDEEQYVEVHRDIPVPWDTIKQIMNAIRDRALIATPDKGGAHG